MSFMSCSITVHAYKLLSTYGAKKTRTSKGFTPFLRRRFKLDLPELLPLLFFELYESKDQMEDEPGQPGN